MAKHAKLTRIALEAGTLSWHHKENLDDIIFFEGWSVTVTTGQSDVHNAEYNKGIFLPLKLLIQVYARNKDTSDIT